MISSLSSRRTVRYKRQLVVSSRLWFELLRPHLDPADSWLYRLVRFYDAIEPFIELARYLV